MGSKRELPTLRRVRLQDFTIYSNQRTVDVELQQGVFCLAGANGLGKSSFLAAINFGYTGRAVNPQRSFKSVREFYEESLDYSRGFFDGRVNELDRETARISLVFDLGPHSYHITRGLFAPDRLRELQSSMRTEISLLRTGQTMAISARLGSAGKNCTPAKLFEIVVLIASLNSSFYSIKFSHSTNVAT